MRAMRSLVLIFGIVAAAAAQSPDPPLSDARLTVHTLLREDVFAGFMANDMERVARAERNLERLLQDRPGDRGNLLAWRGSIALHRAARAHEAGKADEFQRHLTAARDAFAEAAQQTQAMRVSRQLQGVATRCSQIGFLSPSARPPGRRRTPHTRSCGSNRAPQSTNCRCTTAEKSSPASRNRRSGRASSRSRRSTSSGC